MNFIIGSLYRAIIMQLNKARSKEPRGAAGEPSAETQK